MKRISYIVLVIAGLLAACAAPTPLPVQTGVKNGTMRIGHISSQNVSSLPNLLALEALRKQGYTVTQTIFESQDVGVDALSRGQTDISYGGPNAYWPAVQKGANLTAVSSTLGNPYLIVATQAIQKCADLDGKRYGIGNASGTNTFLGKRYILDNCAEAKPEFLTIANSQARTAALLANGLDATAIEIADMQELERQAPGKFHMLADFASAFPKFKFAMVFMNRDFVAKNPEMVKDFIRANMAIYRQVHENPQLVYDAAVTYLKLSPEQAKTAVDAYLASNVWKLNEQDAAEAFRFTLDALVEMGALRAGMQLENVADLTYLNQVLAEAP